ncbi:MAG: 3-hydroxyacyl-CoA dehydrogenase family protein [Planctomycetes bacterium]|nr:3-hydroxyacyl-CoA dehydrogenase family protein [Planctomycetota bacterium]
MENPMNGNELERVVVLGAGTMGSGIAQVAAASGYEAVLYDIDDAAVARGLAGIQATLEKGVQKGKVSEDERATTLSRIRCTTDLADGCAGAAVVIEAAPESMNLKQRIFGDVAGIVDDRCLLATNTSSLAVSEIASVVPRPERFCGLHFFNPPPLMKLLEIVRAKQTTDETIERARAFALRLGKDPIVVKDAPGFASSRLGITLGLEAIRMVEEGVASAEDIDKAMTLGYRHPMGPLQLTDLVGLDVRLAIARYLAEKLDDRRFEPPALLVRMVEEGKLGKKSGQGFYTW